MAEAEQVVHGQDSACDVVTTHRIDTTNPPSHGHDGYLTGQFGEFACGHLRPDEHQTLAAVIDQRSQCTGLVAMRRDSAEHHVVSQLFAGGIHTVDEIGVELLPRGERHADELCPLLTQPTGPRVGSVTDFIGGPPHPLARLLARTRDIAHHD